MTSWLFGLRCVYGAALLLAPSEVLSRLSRTPLDRRARAVARVLGLRELAQAELVRRHPGRRSQLASAAVDGLHAGTMIALAAFDRQRRTLALHNALTASLLGGAALAAAREASCETDNRCDLRGRRA